MRELPLPQDAATAFARKSLDGTWQPAARQRPSRFLRTGPAQQTSGPRFLPVSESGPHPSLLPQQREKTVVIRHTSPLAERVDFPAFSGDTQDLRAPHASHDGSSPAGPHRERKLQPDENASAADVSTGSGGSGIGKDTAGQTAAEPPEFPRPPKLPTSPEGILAAPVSEGESRERTVNDPTYREYITELAGRNFAQIHLEEEGPVGYDITDHILHIRLTPTASPDAIASIADEIEATTPFQRPPTGNGEPFTPQERLELAISNWGVTALPDQLGTDGWKDEPAQNLGVQPGDTKSFREIVESDSEIIQLKRQIRYARAGNDSDQISELELAYVDKIRDYVSRIPYSDNAITPAHTKELQKIDCVTAAFMGTFLSEVGIDYGVASIPTHAALIVRTNDGNLYWSNLQFSTPASPIQPGDISGIDEIVTLEEVSNYIHNPTGQELVVNVTPAASRRDIHTYPGDPRRWVIVAAPGTGHALHTIEGMAEDMEAQGKAAGLLFAAELGRKLSPNNIYLYSLEANAYAKKGEFPRAREIIATALEADPFEPTIWRNLGLIEFYAGDVEASLRAYEKALETDPGDHHSWQELASVHASISSWPKAFVSINAAMQLAPVEARYIAIRGRFYRDTGSLDDALRDFLDATDLEQRNIGFIEQLASLYTQRGEFDEALAQYSRIASLIEPEDNKRLAGVINEMGSIYARTERYEQALQSAGEVIRLLPTDIPARETLASYHDRYGTALRRAGNEGEAEEQFSHATEILREVIALEPDDPVAFIRLAYVSVMQGNFTYAETLLAQGQERITDENRSRTASLVGDRLTILAQRQDWEAIRRGE